MRIEYSAPALGETYLATKKAAIATVRGSAPDLQRLIFQTRHGPKMDQSIPYVAHFRVDFLRVLSVKEEFASDSVKQQFVESVLPFVCRAVQRIAPTWPRVVVLINGGFFAVSCSEGGLFPSKAEIERDIKALDPICSL